MKINKIAIVILMIANQLKAVSLDDICQQIFTAIDQENIHNIENNMDQAIGIIRSKNIKFRRLTGSVRRILKIGESKIETAPVLAEQYINLANNYAGIVGLNGICDDALVRLHNHPLFHINIGPVVEVNEDAQSVVSSVYTEALNEDAQSIVSSVNAEEVQSEVDAEDLNEGAAVINEVAQLEMDTEALNEDAQSVVSSVDTEALYEVQSEVSNVDTEAIYEVQSEVSNVDTEALNEDAQSVVSSVDTEALNEDAQSVVSSVDTEALYEVQSVVSLNEDAAVINEDAQLEMDTEIAPSEVGTEDFNEGAPVRSGSDMALFVLSYQPLFNGNIDDTEDAQSVVSSVDTEVLNEDAQSVVSSVDTEALNEDAQSVVSSADSEDLYRLAGI